MSGRLVAEARKTDPTFNVTLGIGAVVRACRAIGAKLGYRPSPSWKMTEASIRHAQEQVAQLWKDVREMPGNRDDVYAVLASAHPRLKEAEDAVVKARRACEDIDRERKHSDLIPDGDFPRLGAVWKTIDEKLEGE